MAQKRQKMTDHEAAQLDRQQLAQLEAGRVPDPAIMRRTPATSHKQGQEQGQMAMRGYKRDGSSLIFSILTIILL